MTQWNKSAFVALAEGFWATRVANGLTTAEDAETRVAQQKALIDSWHPGSAALGVAPFVASLEPK